MSNLKVGDRLVHHTGSIWRIKEIYPNSIMIGVGASDFVAVSKDGLLDFQDELSQSCFY